MRYLLFPWHTCLWLGRYVNSKDLLMIYDEQIQTLRYPIDKSASMDRISREHPGSHANYGSANLRNQRSGPISSIQCYFSQVQEELLLPSAGLPRIFCSPHLTLLQIQATRKKVERKFNPSNYKPDSYSRVCSIHCTVTSKATQFPVQCPQIPSTDFLSLVLLLCK